MRVPRLAAATFIAVASACSDSSSPATTAPSSSPDFALTEPVASITVAPAVASGRVGDSVVFIATTFDRYGRTLTGRLVTWLSTDTAKVRVSATGVASLRATGTAYVRASSGAVHVYAAVTVVPRPTVAGLLVSPTSASVAVGATIQITASALDSAMQVISGVPLSWKSMDTTKARVSVAGLVTAVALGIVSIQASTNGHTATSQVSVVAPITAAPVASVTVTPSSLSLGIGKTAQLTAALKDANNTVLTGRTVAWGSSQPAVATVSATGLVTAIAGGSATITAVADGQSGQSQVSVTSGVTLGAYPNQPAGFTVLSERSFSAKSEAGWDTYEESQRNFTLISDSTAPKSPNGVGRILYPAGFAGGSSPAVLQRQIQGNYSRIYVSFWMRVSSNWQGHRTGTLKIHHFWSGGKNRAIFTAEGAGSAPLYPTMRLQGGDTPDTRSFLRPNLSSNDITRGRWRRIEMLLIANTVGVNNGQAHWWMDGVKMGQYVDVGFVSTAGARFWEQVQYSPTWGGQLDTVLNDQTLDVDHMYISVAP